MNKKQLSNLHDYAGLFDQIKKRIREAQVKAALSVNAELIRLYWDIGKTIDEKQSQQGWGAGVIPRLAHDLQNEMSEMKGFSERNIKRMLAFFRAYPNPTAIMPQAVAQFEAVQFLPQAVAKLGRTDALTQPANTSPRNNSLLWLMPWGHHSLLLEKIKDLNTRIWYMEQTLQNGWSRDILASMIKSSAHKRQGTAISNFAERLPPAQSDLVAQTLKDPYIFDFLTLEEPFHERELETNLLKHLERFLLELGQGFAFVGRQYHIEVSDKDYYIDLLFYHLKLRCFFVIDLKTGEFKAEHVGKMNFYLSALDDKLRHTTDAPSIGLILCQERDRIIAEYALRGTSQPIGISEYELTRSLPKELQSKLPTIEAIEAELAETKPAKSAKTKSIPKKKRATVQKRRPLPKKRRRNS